MEERWLQLLCFVLWCLCLRLAAISRHLVTTTDVGLGFGVSTVRQRSGNE